MDKNGAAQKLIAIFGHMDFIGLLHSILVETSKYIIIILFAIYTWHCFSVFVGNNTEKKDKVYRRQNKIMYTIHFICTAVLFLNSLDVTILGLYLAQLALLIFVNKAYIYVYENASKMVLNNMLMLCDDRETEQGSFDTADDFCGSNLSDRIVYSASDRTFFLF